MNTLLSNGDGSFVRITGLAEWQMLAIVGFQYVSHYIVPVAIVGMVVWAILTWRRMNREARIECQQTLDRIAKLDADNERMITLLTEIRDRLPERDPPPGVRLVA